MTNKWILPIIAAAAIAGAGCEQTPVDAAQVEGQVSTAQDASVTMMGGAAGILRFREALDLTDTQVSEIRNVLADLRERNAPLREQLRASGEFPRRPAEGEELSAGAQEIRGNSQAAALQIQEILTSEQRALAKQLFEERREQARERRTDGEARTGRKGPGLSAGMLPRLDDELALTDDQVAQIEAIRLELREKNQPLLEQLRESGERPHKRSDRESNPAFMELRSNAETAAEAVRSVLTEQQQASLNELRERRARRGVRGG